MTIPHIDIDAVMSDPLLLSFAFLFFFGIGLFFFSIYKLIQLKKKENAFVVPHQDDETAPVVTSETTASPETISPPQAETPQTVDSYKEPEKLKPEPPQRPGRIPSADQTVVLAPGVSDLQAEFEIAISQIKHLNKKVQELEWVVDRLQNQTDAKLDPNELKEPPMDPSDFTKKLLKVVEHVIILEKEVSKLSSKPSPSIPSPANAPSNVKPPVMPL